MRFPPLLLVAGALAASFPRIEAAPAPQTAPKTGTQGVVFTSRAERFSVWLPAKPRQNKHVKVLKGGQQSITTLFNAQAAYINYIISIAPHAFPTQPAQTKAALDEMQRDIIQSSHATLQKSADIQQNGFRGRELHLSVAGGKALFRGRIFLTPRGSYSLGAAGYESPMKKQAAQINRAFNSFRILPQ